MGGAALGAKRVVVGVCQLIAPMVFLVRGLRRSFKGLGGFVGKASAEHVSALRWGCLIYIKVGFAWVAHGCSPFKNCLRLKQTLTRCIQCW